MHGVARIRGSSGDTCRVGRCELGISQVALSQGYDKYGNFSLSSEDAKMSRRWVSVIWEEALEAGTWNFTRIMSI